MTSPGPGAYDPATQPACVRHPDRPTGLACARCGRPACAECLQPAPVGFQCDECVRAGSRTVRRPRARSDGATAVVGLVAANVAIYLVTVLQAGSVRDNRRAGLFGDWSLVPVWVVQGQWWRMVTTGFLHYGPVHLLFNMWALYVLGRDLEVALGRARFLTLYGVSLLGGSTAAFLFSGPGDETAGASGAVFGMMGALVILLRRMRLSARPALILIGVNVAMSLVIPGISLSGHLGGLAVGVATTAALVYPSRVGVRAAGLTGVVLVLAGLVAVRAAAISSAVGIGAG